MASTPTHRITTHPGALLLEQIQDCGLSVHQVARDTGLPPTRLHEIVHERRGVSAETAIALGEFFGQSPEFWMNLQKNFELSRELLQNGAQIRSRVRPCTLSQAHTQQVVSS